MWQNAAHVQHIMVQMGAGKGEPVADPRLVEH